MSLQNIFEMVKADKYTADGREELIKARNEEVEDHVYKIGEISQKTGLMKTANGWVKPKKGNGAPAKKEEFNGVKINKKAEEQSKREGRTDILPSGISTDDFSDKQLSEDGENVILNYKNGEKATLNKDGEKTEPKKSNESKDSAPRVLTGDTKIRIRK